MWCGNADLKGVYAEGGVQGYGEKVMISEWEECRAMHEAG